MPLSDEAILRPSTAQRAEFLNIRRHIPGPADDTLTISELARILRLGRTRVYELAARDELPVPALRVGQQYRFSRRALDAWLNHQHPDQVSAA